MTPFFRSRSLAVACLALLAWLSPAHAENASPAKVARLVGVALPSLSVTNQVRLCREPVRRWSEYRVDQLAARAISSLEFDEAGTLASLAELRDLDILLREAWGVAAAADSGFSLNGQALAEKRPGSRHSHRKSPVARDVLAQLRQELGSAKDDRAVLQETTGLSSVEISTMAHLSRDQAYRYWGTVCAGIVQKRFHDVVGKYYATQKLHRRAPSAEAWQAANVDLRAIKKRRGGRPGHY